MDKSLFQQAKETVVDMLNMDSDGNHTDDKRAAMKAIQEAYHQASPEEQQELHELEQELNKNAIVNFH